jgi:hypothetical protein
MPALVTFGDLRNPDSARLVKPLAFADAFGPGYEFRTMSIEIERGGYWPLTAMGLAPRPRSNGIEGKLLWWNQPGRPAQRARLAMLNWIMVGTSSVPENFFRRK